MCANATRGAGCEKCDKEQGVTVVEEEVVVVG